MKGKITALLLLLVVLTAGVLMAGCTQPTPSAQPGNSTITATPAPTKTATISQGILMFDKSKFNTFEYDIYVSDGKAMARVGKIKAEYEIVPYGNISDARHMRETRVIGEGSQASTTITDLYYKQDNNWILGGHASTTSASGTTEKDIPEDDSAYWNYDMATISSNVQFYDEGSELVTVPKGFYPAATKYTSTDSGITLWMATGVPVPVKIAGKSLYNNTVITTTMELVSYA